MCDLILAVLIRFISDLNVVYDYKLFANYFCKKAPSWMLDRVLNRSMKFMWYYIFYAMVVSKK